MAGRKIRDEAEARACLARAAQSGLPRAEWARAHGIDARSLNAWRLNLAWTGTAHTPVTPPLRLVELVASASPPSAVPLRVRCGPFVVEVASDFDDAVLGRLLATVARC